MTEEEHRRHSSRRSPTRMTLDRGRRSSSRYPAASRASAGSGPTSGPTRASSTSAIRGDLSELEGSRYEEEDTLRRRARRATVHRRRQRRDGPSDGGLDELDRRPRRGRRRAQGRHQRCHPKAPWRSSPTGFSAPRSARTRSPAWAAAWLSTAGSDRSSSSCTPTSCGSPPTRSSTRSPRPGTCSAARARCRWCCAASWRPAPATAPSTRWIPRACSRPRRACASWRPRIRSTTSG